MCESLTPCSGEIIDNRRKYGLPSMVEASKSSCLEQDNAGPANFDIFWKLYEACSIKKLWKCFNFMLNGQDRNIGHISTIYFHAFVIVSNAITGPSTFTYFHAWPCSYLFLEAAKIFKCLCDSLNTETCSKTILKWKEWIPWIV